MNDVRDDSEDFSLERHSRAGRDSNKDKDGDGSASNSASADKSSSLASHDSAFPDRIRRKYYVVANDSGKDERGVDARLYADNRGEYLAFKTTEDRLVTRLIAVDVIRDMISVAQHRQWDALHVRGSAEFRREAWLEANARGMEVRGYQPTDLDRQALTNRQEAWSRAHPRASEAEFRSASYKDELAEKIDYDKGVSGRLIEVGRAPYRNRADAEISTYLAIELDNGRQHQVWGVGLEKATADSKAIHGDRIQVRREGVERVTKDIKVIDPKDSSVRSERRHVSRNRWQVTAERFRSVDPQLASHDPDLVTMQSHMVIIQKTLERTFPKDKHLHQSIMGAAKERIAQHLEKGSSFARATIIAPVRDREQSELDSYESRQKRSNEGKGLQERAR